MRFRYSWLALLMIPNVAWAIDSDGDGLEDELELEIGTDPAFLDTDLDGIWDGAEYYGIGDTDLWDTNPVVPDLDEDGDGVTDALEQRCSSLIDVFSDSDADDDLVDNQTEGLGGGSYPNTDQDSLPDFCDADDDNDDVPTWAEPDQDSDGDGSLDRLDSDANGNGVSDGVEGRGDGDCDGVPDFADRDALGACGDPDGDGVLNLEEYQCGSSPEREDTDGDGVLDAQESCEEDGDCDQLPDRLDALVDGDCDPQEPDPRPEACDYDDDTLDCGRFTGGSCSSMPGEAALLWGGLLGLLVVGKRGRKVFLGGGFLSLMGGTSAQAYELGTDVQLFHPGFSRYFFRSEDPVIQSGFVGGLTASYAHDPLLYRYDQEGVGDVAVVGSLLATDVAAGWSVGRLRVGAIFPLYPLVMGESVATGPRMGDVRMESAVVVLDRNRGGVGLGVLGAVTLPTGAAPSGMGEPGLTGEGWLNLSFGKTSVFAARAGFASGSRGYLGDFRAGPHLGWGVGLSIPVSDLYLVAEAEGQAYFSQGMAGFPMEWRAGVRVPVQEHVVVGAAVGTGIGQGVGAPLVRAVASVAWVPEVPRLDVPDPVGGDMDRDGVGDEVDMCPTQPEDRNGVRDEDGCPDQNLTPTRVLVQNPAHEWVAGARLALISGPETGRWELQDGQLARSLKPGKYRVRVEADGYEALELELDVPKAEIHEQVIELAPLPSAGSVLVAVTDAAGAPVVATVAVMGTDRVFTTTSDGRVTGRLPAGTHELFVRADGYRPEKRQITVEAGGQLELRIALSALKARVESGEIKINDKIFFEFDSAEIKPESRVILDDVAQVMIEHPEIVLLEVEGHTDDVGEDAYNLQLSDQRADAVMRYLMSMGVEPERLVARGYGESKPLISETTEAARDVNRRVVFRIVKQAQRNEDSRRKQKE